ncbi:MAG: aldehyde ferredoxin oxidoreductase C-terminal domain-containing protein, partial [Nitrososphaeraceae archaeon]|nr:aldehyde ferredoxin oxidoreductase C-terminal domain-containing protein [Nitrososphaeraceae archaeon]
CYEKGILDKSDLDNIDLKWGAHKAIVQLTEKILKREGVGDLLADGVKIASEKIGKGSEEFAMHIGGQELPAHHTLYDPSLAITYTFEPTPGRHTQANQNLGHKEFKDLFPEIDFDFCAGGKKDVFSGRIKEIKINLFYVHALNVIGACMFAGGGTFVRTHPKYLSAITGWKIELDEFLMLGERVMNLRQVFNIREGNNSNNYKLSNRILGIPPVKDGKIANIAIDFNSMVEEFYQEMDWDINTNKPNINKLKKLNLDWTIKDIW